MSFYTVGAEDNVCLWLVQAKLLGVLSKTVGKNNSGEKELWRAGRQGPVKEQERDVVMRFRMAEPVSSILNSSFPLTYLRCPGSAHLKTHF